MTTTATPKAAADRYNALEAQRQPYVQRARDAAKLTIPSLMPDEGTNGSTTFPSPYQSLGARGVNNISSKTLLALLPVNAPFFRLNLGDDHASDVDSNPQFKQEVERALGVAERRITTHIETSNLRVSSFEGMKQLFVAGNVLCYVDEDGGMKVYRLDKYVCKRDPSGNPVEIAVREKIAVGALDESIRTQVLAQVQKNIGSENSAGDIEVDIYTYIWLEPTDGMYHIQQEVEGQIVPGSEGTYPKDRLPWLPLRLIRVDGEDYGRGHVEEHMGDLKSLEALTKAIVTFSAAAAKVVLLVDPNGVTRLKDLNNAESGEGVVGKEGEVHFLQMEKYNDFRVAESTADKMEQRLSQAFLLNSSIQRQAERVTAEEIRYMAGELEDALGGIYSILSQEFQLPLIRRLMTVLTKKKSLPVLPKGMVEPSITTGLEALSRGHDLTKLQQWTEIMVNTFGQPAMAMEIDPAAYGNLVATNLALDIEGVIKSPEQKQAEQQQAAQQQQQSEAMKTLVPQAMQAQVAREGHAKDIAIANSKAGPQQAPDAAGDGAAQ